MILYSPRKHLNPHTREIIKGDGMKANLAWTGLFSVCCTTVFKSEFAWKICKHKIKFRHHMSRVMAYTILREVSHTSPRITLPSPSTATLLIYTLWNHGRWEQIPFGGSQWRFHRYNFSLSCRVIFPMLDIWKNGFSLVERKHGSRSLFPFFFLIFFRLFVIEIIEWIPLIISVS